jgi:hypothetical protein
MKFFNECIACILTACAKEEGLSSGCLDALTQLPVGLRSPPPFTFYEPDIGTAVVPLCRRMLSSTGSRVPKKKSHKNPKEIPQSVYASESVYASDSATAELRF